MKVTANIDDLAKHLAEVKLDIENRLKLMVRQFSFNIADAAIGFTPLGNASLYPALYEQRRHIWGLRPEEGYARGSWQVSLDGTLDKQELYGAGSGETALSAVRTHLMNYNLGEEIIIGNPAHYIGNLEGLYGPPSSKNAPQGIMKPATDKIMNIYAIRLDDYYNAGKNWSGGWQ